MARQQLQHPLSDQLSLLRLFGAYLTTLSASPLSRAMPSSKQQRKKRAKAKRKQKRFCTKYGLRPRALKEALQLVGQLFGIVQRLLDTSKLVTTEKGGVKKKEQRGKDQEGDKKKKKQEYSRSTGQQHIIKSLSRPPSQEQDSFLRQIIAAGLVDNVARKVPLAVRRTWEQKLQAQEMAREDGNPVFRISLKGAYQCVDRPHEPVFIHSESVLAPYELQPEYLVYHEKWKGNDKDGREGRTYLKGLTAIKPEWLLRLAPSCLLDRSAPLSEPLPSYSGEKDSIMCYRQV